MYAQWRSVEDYQAMARESSALPYFQQALTISKFDPGIYEVRRDLLPSRIANLAY